MITPKNKQASQNPTAIRSPYSRTAIPTAKALAASKKSVLLSITDPITIKIVTIAVNNPKNAICFVFTCMNRYLLPYIHTNCLHTINHNKDFQFHKLNRLLHIPLRYFDSGYVRTGVCLQDQQKLDYLVPSVQQFLHCLMLPYYFPSLSELMQPDNTTVQFDHSFHPKHLTLHNNVW